MVPKPKKYNGHIVKQMHKNKSIYMRKKKLDKKFMNSRGKKSFNIYTYTIKYGLITSKIYFNHELLEIWILINNYINIKQSTVRR